MTVQVIELFRVIIVRAEPEVAVFINVYLEWVPGRDYYPHSDVKLTPVYQHRVANIFLDHPSLLSVRRLIILILECNQFSWINPSVDKDALHIIEYLDISTAT